MIMSHRSPDHSVVTFAGPDALAFLQSQLSNDVALLAVGAWQWQGYCSAKGRLYATFALVRTADDAFAAVVHNTTVTALVKRLTMFRLRSKLTIESSPSLQAWLHLAKPPEQAHTIATLDLGAGRWITLEQNQAAPDVTNAAGADDEFMRQWNRIGIDAMQPEVTAATAEMFVPQMIAWDTIQPGGGVSFSKGCYPGQEVVARAHYRGAVKRHLERQILAPGAVAAEGGEVTLQDGRIAEVCNLARDSAGQTTALVVASTSTAIH
jgi:folate-binding protein YgfZ